MFSEVCCVTLFVDGPAGATVGAKAADSDGGDFAAVSDSDIAASFCNSLDLAGFVGVSTLSFGPSLRKLEGVAMLAAGVALGVEGRRGSAGVICDTVLFTPARLAGLDDCPPSRSLVVMALDFSSPGGIFGVDVRDSLELPGAACASKPGGTGGVERRDSLAVRLMLCCRLGGRAGKSASPINDVSTVVTISVNECSAS